MNGFANCLLGAALGFVLGVPPASQGQPKEPGDLWEVTSEMSMPGMPAGMAPRQPPQRVCRAHNADRPPVADSDRCEMSNVNRPPAGPAKSSTRAATPTAA